MFFNKPLYTTLMAPLTTVTKLAVSFEHGENLSAKETDVQTWTVSLFKFKICDTAYHALVVNKNITFTFLSGNKLSRRLESVDLFYQDALYE